MIGVDSQPRLAPGVRIQADRVRGGFNLLGPEHVLRMNTSSAAILNLCDGQRSVRAIVDRLAQEYEIDRGRIESETIALFQDLIARRMVET